MISTAKQIKDTNEFPRMVINILNNLIVLANKVSDSHTFSGMVIHSTEPNYSVGEYKVDWMNEAFQRFVGDVNLAQ